MKKYNQLKYDAKTAIECGVPFHPQQTMWAMGYKLLGSVPQSLYDCWWFTVEDFIEPLPPFLTKMEYNFDYWHNYCNKDCEYFAADPCCCHGGKNCLKINGDTVIKQ